MEENDIKNYINEVCNNMFKLYIGKLPNYDEDLKELKDTVSSLSAKLDSLSKNTIPNLNSKIDNTNNMNIELKASSDENQKKLDELKNSRDKLIEENNQFRIDNTLLKNNYENTERKLEEQKGEYLKLRDDYSKQSEEKNNLTISYNTVLHDKEGLQKNYDELINKYNILSTDFSSSENNRKNAELELNKIKDCAESNRKQLESTIDKLSDDIAEKDSKIEELSSNYFVKAESIFKIYNSLSDGLKSNLRMFATNKYESFIANGVQWANISALWQVAKTRISNHDLSEVDKISSIFQFFFNMLNDGSDNARYVLINPKIGEKFDRDFYTSISDNDGESIESVILPGYKDIKTNEINKALVKLC